MNWLRNQVKRGLNPRTYILLGLLVLVLAWIQSLDAKRKTLRSQAVTAVAPAAPAAPARPAPSKGRPAEIAAAEGWGRDPFERRVLDGGEPQGGGRAVVRGRERSSR